MRDLVLRLPPALKRRVGLAAAAQDEQFSQVCRHVLVTRELPTEAREVVDVAGWHRVTLQVSDTRHEAIRVKAAILDVSINALCVAALWLHVPNENETFADVFNKE